MSEFLDKLKNAVENGDFNSEAAKKIIDIDNLATKKISQVKNNLTEGEMYDINNSEVADSVEKRLEEAGKKTVTEEEALLANAEAEKKMLILKQTDAVNTQLATLIEIEDMVKATIDDMMSFVAELDNKFAVEIEKENPIFGDLSQKIEQIKSKYSSIINN